MVAIATGMEGCPCINTTTTLSTLTDRYCTLSNGQKGIQLTLGGSCVPFSYGASTCQQHDLLHDPSCKLDQLITDQTTLSNNATNSNNIVPPYCFRAFCFVDAKTCRKHSEERVYRSGYFGYDESNNENIDVYYSYSTCNSTADDWLEVENDIVGSRALGGIDIEA